MSAPATTEGPTRAERVLNLLALLLDTNVPIPRHEILARVAGYPTGEGEAARRAFERDKEMLRSMGVPVVVTYDPSGTEQQYDVRPDEYYLPDLGLTDDESAALRVAVNAVALGGGAGHGALMKLGASNGHAAPPIAALPMVPQLAPLFDASRRRCVVTFTYRGERRTVEPWAIVGRRGRWYVLGHDRGRGALRTFRADRIGRDIRTGEPGAFEVPSDFEPASVGDDAPWQFGDDEVRVRIEVDRSHLDEFLAAAGPDARLDPARDDRRARGNRSARVVSLDVANRAALRNFLLRFEEHVEVLEPAEVRAETIAWLEHIVGSQVVEGR
jgi:proteasome accessory factor B